MAASGGCVSSLRSKQKAAKPQAPTRDLLVGRTHEHESMSRCLLMEGRGEGRGKTSISFQIQTAHALLPLLGQFQSGDPGLLAAEDLGASSSAPATQPITMCWALGKRVEPKLCQMQLNRTKKEAVHPSQQDSL